MSAVTEAATTALNAAIAILESRERTARTAYAELNKRLMDDANAPVPALTAEERQAEIRDRSRAHATWYEARAALADVRALLRP